MSARNRLADETSPYLLQHADNPVAWHPWGEEAFARARRLDRPILLSVGYAACHWCHVMERESFEDPDTARLMNDHFVCVKVDREERPDVDDVYMRAVQMLTGHGGWPLTVFLTPALEPFAGGTYFPPEDRPYMPSFRRVLSSIAELWEKRRGEVEALAAQVRERLQAAAGARAPSSTGEQASAPALDRAAGGRASPAAAHADAGVASPAPAAAETLPPAELIDRAAMQLHDRFDPDYGGFTPAPKFPNTTWLALLMRYGAGQGDTDLLEEALFTLEQMIAGGIHDQVGGGFHRYATDARWLVPHFEKMLYDNALLADSLLDALQISGREAFARTATRTFEWMLREMRSPEGGLYSTLDADSEGVEGRYYAWSAAEIDAVLGRDAGLFRLAYGVSDSGNWEGTNVLHLPRPLSATAREAGLPEPEVRRRLERALERLRAAREARVRPALDDKILADWNGLAIAALARGARVLDRPDLLEAAVQAAEFVFREMVVDGVLRHAWRVGRARHGGYLDDYAAMLAACLELFESSFEPRWLARARWLADTMMPRFWDEDGGGFFFTAAQDDGGLIVRPKSAQDGATPAGNGIAARALQRLAAITGEQDYARRSRATIIAFAEPLRRVPFAFASLLLALESHLAPPSEFVVVGSDSVAVRAALGRLWRRYDPNALVLWLDPSLPHARRLAEEVPALRGREPLAGDPTFYRCHAHTCGPPCADLDALLRA